MRKSLLIILIALNMLTIASCFDYTEYEEMQLLFGFGIDSSENNDGVVVTVQSSGFKKTDKQSDGMNGGGSSGGNQFSSIYKASGRTILETINKLQQIMGKELFFGYIKVIVVGNEAAKKDMDKIMSFLYMSPRVRGSTYLVIAKDKAYDTLGTVNLNDSDLSSKSLENILRRSVRSGVSFPIVISDYYNISLTEGWEPAVPQVYYKRNNDIGNNQNYDNSDDAEIVIEQQGYHTLKNMVVFKKNKKVGVLNEKESLCFGLIADKKVRSNYIIIDDKDKKNNEEYFSGFRILHNKSKIKTYINEDEILVRIDISIQASLEEYMKSENLINLDIIKDSEKILSKEIKENIEETIKKVQKEYKSDIFGFGRKIFQQHTKKWDEEYRDKWDEIFPKVKTQVTVDAKLINTGSKVESTSHEE